MRLLRHNNDGEFDLTNDLEGRDAIPPYAILSHTWGLDAEEVTFEDMKNSSGQNKPGYKKLQFCGDQARRDGLQHFWIDTCCINKENRTELSQAIRSMFRWYHDATRCYVYLSDVSSGTTETDKKGSSLPLRQSDFQKSRWFTRGWTLQELLAPGSVEFFSQEWEKLGNRTSLQQYISNTTGIPESALQGNPLSQFSIEDRFSWNEHRHTTLEEDRAYSLQGIFGVHVSPIYSEGAGEAFKRLRGEIDKLNGCIQDLYLTDPRDDKKRIEDTKGGLLKDSYRWIFDNADFRQWQDGKDSQLLWIKGDPGKGKTMLLCGIVDELKKSKARTDLLSFFFCQATDLRINNATAVLRGLLYLLIDQQPSLFSHIREKYSHARKTLFEDANAWVALTEILTSVLRDPSMDKTCLIIDALDECVVDLPKLLQFVGEQSASSRVKWIISSRNWPDIEEQLERAGHKVNLSLELNEKSVSTAVGIFVEQKVSQLAQQKRYDKQTQDAVRSHLLSNANNTFLWVALVCQNLERVSLWNVIKKLEVFPPGLGSLYTQMMRQINASEDAGVCKQILASVAITYRPITIKELTSLVEQLEDMIKFQGAVQKIIGSCGSFLTMREETVYFVHQSAKDFLLTNPSEETSNGAFGDVFPSGTSGVHYEIFRRSLHTMSTTLRRDIYELGASGCFSGKVSKSDTDPLAASRYACSYWIDHLKDSDPSTLPDRTVALQDKGPVHNFLREKYLYWLESLSLCREMSKGVESMAKLETLVQNMPNADELSHLVKDARRFIMYHKGAIEYSPLQVYASALLFSPAGSRVRNLFKGEEPKWIKVKPPISNAWSACLQTLEGHSSWVYSVAFSHDSTRLASASVDKTVRIWDAGSGACLQTLEGHSGSVNSVAFSHDSTRLASASHDKTVRIWDAGSGACLQTLEGHSSWVYSVAFSHDSTRLASASDDNTVRIWDAGSGACLQTLEGHSGWVYSVAFSHDSTRLASASHDKTVRIWDAGSGACLQTLEGHSSWVYSVAFSHDSTRLASASHDNTVRIWDTGSGACLQTLEIGKTLDGISFDPTGSHLYTEIGAIAITASPVSQTVDDTRPQYQGAGVSIDGAWITYKGENILWLPSEYRPSCSTVSEKSVSIGVRSGKVWICSFLSPPV